MVIFIQRVFIYILCLLQDKFSAHTFYFSSNFFSQDPHFRQLTNIF